MYFTSGFFFLRGFDHKIKGPPNMRCNCNTKLFLFFSFTKLLSFAQSVMVVRGNEFRAPRIYIWLKAIDDKLPRREGGGNQSRPPFRLPPPPPHHHGVPPPFGQPSAVEAGASESMGQTHQRCMAGVDKQSPTILHCNVCLFPMEKKAPPRDNLRPSAQFSDQNSQSRETEQGAMIV